MNKIKLTQGICKNCGGHYEIHQAETNNCPVNGREAAPGKVQLWDEKFTFQNIPWLDTPATSPSLSVPAERKNWQFIGYDKKGKEIESFTIEDRTEQEADNEAMRYVESHQIIDDWSITPAPATSTGEHTPDEFEEDYNRWFEQRRQTFRGINAGEYIDREDFETYGRWAANQMQQQAKDIEVANGILQQAYDYIQELYKIKAFNMKDNFELVNEGTYIRSQIFNRLNQK